jgi:hypothetical protein
MTRDLLIRPTSFFQQLDQPLPIVTFVAAYVYGVAGMIDRLGVHALRADAGGSPSAWALVSDNWLLYWGFCLIAGAVSGAVYFLLGGWWYRKRLQWSGAQDPDIDAVRRVYLIAAQVYTVPLLLYTAWETLVYSTPRTAYNGDDILALFVLVFLFWSVVTSYRGACAMFSLRAWPARIWFLILPSGVYSLSVIGVAAVFLLGLLASSPQIEQPVQLEKPAVTLQYPANWDVSSDTGADPDRSFSIEPSFEDAAVHVFVYDFPLNTFDASLHTINSLSENFKIGEMEAIDRWGGFKGMGYDLGLTLDGKKYEATTFSFSYSKVSFEIIEISEADAATRLEPGFGLIRDSFEFQPHAVR